MILCLLYCIPEFGVKQYYIHSQDDCSEEVTIPQAFTTPEFVPRAYCDLLQIPSAAVEGHVELAPGEQISLNNSAAAQKAISDKSVIRMTQEDQLKTVFIVVSGAVVWSASRRFKSHPGHSKDSKALVI